MGTMNSDRDVVFLSAVRTPFGSFGGSVKDWSAGDLAVESGKAAVERAGADPDDFDQVYYGNVIQTSKDAAYLARHVGLGVGLPTETPACTVNRLCGSGFQAIVEGARDIMVGTGRVALTGGTESMSKSPHVVRGARWGLRLGPGADFEDMLWEALTDSYCGFSMAETAENLAEEYDIDRRAADEYAVRSQQRAKEAWDEGRFDEEVLPLTVEERGEERTFHEDEHMRPDTTLEALSDLNPYFKKDGLVTAGNASGMGDGAASVVVTDSDYADANGLEPMGRLVSWAFAGVEPRIMGIGPAPAIRQALDRADLELEDIDVIEVNEAFAPQYLAVEKELGLDREKVNVNGGAIALTHPLGATGARITGHVLHELRRRGGGLGIASACIGGGQGGAVIVEV
ncbi:MAG: thiolase family protein [Candidatus Palauibacterales bacterium]|nr:thiolase family protein [Candidatus Palauibacterales bacterium]